MIAVKFQQAMKNPNVVFAAPERVEVATEFSIAQKVAILGQWKDQLHQLLVADEEGMLRAETSGASNAECLRRVTDSVTRLFAGIDSLQCAADRD